MKDIFDAVNSRIRTPYFGYAVLAFFAFNWRGVFLLATTTGSPLQRLAAFDSATNTNTLILFPLLVGIFVAASTHWVQYVFVWISRKPSSMMDVLHLQAEHNRNIHQTKFEQSRAALFAVKEKELIERAKRDEEISEIEGDETKEKLAKQIENLRLQRDQLTATIRKQSKKNNLDKSGLSSEALEILKAAAEDENGAIIKSENLTSPHILAGNHKFGIQGVRDFAKYDAALKDLIGNGLVTSMGGTLILTHKGWQTADALHSH
jgi:hypothetical protein